MICANLPSDMQELATSQLRPIDRLARESADALGASLRNSASLHRETICTFESEGAVHEIERYLFIGPRGGGRTIKLAIFAGIHGDEVEGVHAAVRFVKELEANPDLARGYCLFVYPLCNPTGFADGTRTNRAGKDLNREFWRGSSQPEVRALESELAVNQFDGIIALHTDCDSYGFYGYAHGATFTRELVLPALAAAERFLPINRGEIIDGFRARDGIVGGRFEGILSAPPEVSPKPFEVILETPSAALSRLKEAAFAAALRNLLEGYREFIAYAPDL